MHVIGCQWVYKTQLKTDGTIECLKGRLIAKGFHQVDGVDFSETFSLVVKPRSVHLVLSLALT